jgi:crotonobetainyl-CoA:carnitine CoA-transferase CaiB-like acyl-CoA transferase
VSDPRFADGLSRFKNHDLIDTLVSEVTSSWSADELQRALQAVGVPAGAVLDGKALLFNEHLNARGFYEVVSHAESSGMPPLPYASRPWKFGETPGEIKAAAPTLGQHNRSVLSDLLGFDDSRIADMRDSGVIGTSPVNPRASRQASNEMLLSQGRIVRWETDFEEQVRRKFVDK